MYHLLLVRYKGSWSIEFGDYEKETVRFEYNEYKRNGEYKAKDLKMISSSSDKQEDIDKIIRIMNNPVNLF